MVVTVTANTLNTYSKFSSKDLEFMIGKKTKRNVILGHI